MDRGLAAGGRRCRRQLRRRMAGAMTFAAQIIVIEHRAPIGVPGSERGVAGIKRRSHGAIILGQPQALVGRDAQSRFLSTRQSQAAAA
jgi:hypothetical protein